jgi:hypothetical protein
MDIRVYPLYTALFEQKHNRLTSAYDFTLRNGTFSGVQGQIADDLDLFLLDNFIFYDLD